MLARSEPKIRSAKPEDFDGIVDLCRQLHEENGITDVDWNCVYKVVVNGINGDGATIGLIGPCDNLGGMVLIRFANVWYSDKIILEELYNYVPPQHRKSRNANALITFAKECSDKLDIPLLIGILSQHRTRAKVRLYERVFGEPAGAFFLYNGRTGRP